MTPNKDVEHLVKECGDNSVAKASAGQVARSEGEGEAVASVLGQGGTVQLSSDLCAAVDKLGIAQERSTLTLPQLYARLPEMEGLHFQA